jgi:hypothetical protein
MTLDRRVSDALSKVDYVGFTWNDAVRALDLAEMNAKAGGRWSWGRLKAQKVEKK